MKRIKYNYYIIGIISTLLALALWSNVHWHNSNKSQLQRIINSGELRLSTINSPLTYQYNGKNISGLDYELAQRFAQYLGVQLKIVLRPTPLSLFNDLEKNSSDVAAAGLLYNKKRLNDFAPGPAYYSVSQQLVYHKGNLRPKSLGDLNGNLVVESDSTQIDILQRYQQKYPNLHWDTTDYLSNNELLQRVRQGKLDYTITDSVSIALFQRIHPHIAVAFDISDEEPVMWYIKKTDDDSFYAAMVDFFNQITKDGTLAKLEEKYLGHVGEFDYVDARTFLGAIDTVLPSLKNYFQKYATRFDWRILAAISYQESHWNPAATSPTGVRGLMMLTKDTASELGIKDRLNSEESIAGGANYLEQIIDKLPGSIPPDEQIWFALAAYNMGYGHMLDLRELTQKQGANPNSWLDVKQRLPLLSQKKYITSLNYGYARGYEAYQYVENVRRYLMSLESYLHEKEKQEEAAKQHLRLISEGYPAMPHSKIM